MGLYEAFKLLHRKGNNQLSEKATDELGENHISDKGLTLQNIQRISTTQQ